MTKMYVNAAKALSVSADVVENSVKALSFVMLRAAAVSASGDRLLEGLDVPISDELRKSLTEFYLEVLEELHEVKLDPVVHVKRRVCNRRYREPYTYSCKLGEGLALAPFAVSLA